MHDSTFAFIALALAACSSAPAARRDASAPSPPAAEPDTVAQFLLSAAATDFHTHPPGAIRFRDVRVGHVRTSDGEAQYLMCGQFLPAESTGAPTWTRFATVKTSGYEQWIGPPTERLCQRTSIVWQHGELSRALQRRLESLR